MLNPPQLAVSWQESLKRAIRSPQELLAELGISERELPYSQTGLDDFPLFVTREFVRRMNPGDPNDPLLRQVWPATEEGIRFPGDLIDPVGDLQVETSPGVLHKYEGRVLLIASGVCAVHCRYCFRRHFPYEQAPKHLREWEESLHAIQQDRSVREVILSGGDPLSLVDANLSQLIERIENVEQVNRLRIHTRLPVVIPQRVTEELVEMLDATRLSVWIVLHINHPNEIDRALADAIGRLRSSGATLLNQAVLLKGVNDSEAPLAELFERLVDLNVLPYYLHQLDRVEGGRHWEVPVEKGRDLIAALRRRLPGYAVPQFVKEISGEPHKTPLS